MSTRKTFQRYIPCFIFLVFLFHSLPIFAESMEDYCIVPPYVKRDVKPNILIMMDNSQNMGDEAYTDAYDSTKTYSGLFKPNLMYKYVSNQWQPDSTGIYSGNLLNWASTSKYDLLQSILVGGKSTSRQTNVNTLISLSNTWTKTLRYVDSTGTARSCIINVSGSNIEIKDETPNSCGYLDSPAHPLVTFNHPDQSTQFAQNVPSDKEIDRSRITIMKHLTKHSLGLLNAFLNFLVPDAEAAPALRLQGGNPPRGTECTPYGASLSASGGSETGYTWSVDGQVAGTGGCAAGLYPIGSTGLCMNPSGTPSTVIAGTIKVSSGNHTFSVTVRDSAGTTATEGYTLRVDDATATITTGSQLQEGYVGSYYSVPINTFPCSSSSITLTGGALPPLYFFSGNLVRGNEIPLTTANTYNFTARVTDVHGNTSAAKAFTIKINPPLVGLTIASGSPLVSGNVGSPYFIYIESAGGTPAYGCGGYTWSVIGALPPGLTLTTFDCYYSYISGTPTASGPYSFTIEVTDSLGAVATKVFSLTIDAPIDPIRTTGNRNVRICAGTYTCNCNTSPSCLAAACSGACSEVFCPPTVASPGNCVLKTGIVDMFWPQARFGLEDFSKVSTNAIPNISNCIEANPGATPDSNFLTAIENAVPIDLTTTLVNGAYEAMDYYANDNTANCDPFRNSQSCQRNFSLMISSGVGADNPPNPIAGTPSVWSDVTNCGLSAYKNLSKNTCFGYNNDLRNNPTLGADNLPGRQYVSTYVVNTMGTSTTMADGECDPGTTPTTTGDILCQASVLGGGVYYEVTDPATLRETLIQAFQDIIKRAAAGTAASVLASGEGSGANLIQAVFYPRRKEGNTEIAWIGRLTNFWYFADPFFSGSAIYEDNASSNIFDLSDDNKIMMYYDISNEKTMAHRYPPSGTLADIEFERLDSLWEAGLKLWERDITVGVDPRTIKASTGGSVVDFTTTNAATIEPLFNLSTTLDMSGFAYADLNRDGAVDTTDAQILIRYVNGEDFTSDSWIRDRTVAIDLNGDGDRLDAGEGAKVWKLGDILNSTPKISSWIPINTYDQIYRDTSYKAYLETANYQGRGMVFAGGNDGMLHAFKLGTLEVRWTGQTSTQKARLTGSDLGKEIWAFIPKNALPYLQYQTRTDYCHVYTIDFTPYVFDASIGTTGCAEAEYKNCAKYDAGNNPISPATDRWRTILIGGMRFGGACKNTCPDSDCVETPATDLGYSTYFALDVTDQSNPTLMWEFSNEDLGFTTSGPTIVRTGADKSKNGKWFVIFGSGPTGPISTSDQQFLGRSDQNLKFFVLDLKTGSLLSTIDTAITNAFSGSLLNATIDVDQDYQDDVVYAGYVEKNTLAGTWTDGGVIRIMTKENDDPAQWSWQDFYDSGGPVTSAVVKLVNKRKGQLWVYFGSGRYFYEQLASVDDENSQRTLFGLKDPCYSTSGLDPTCVSTFTGTITDVTNTPDVTSDTIADGWKIDLEPSGSYTYAEGNPAVDVTRNYRAERVITDPLATTSGLVFFTSYKPYNDVCAYGGKSFIWAVRYNTGGAPGALLKGIGLLQVSTGSIEQLDLSSAFTEKGGRRTSALEGVPPTHQGLSLLSTPPPVKRVIHMRER